MLVIVTSFAIDAGCHYHHFQVDAMVVTGKLTCNCGDVHKWDDQQLLLGHMDNDCWSLQVSYDDKWLHLWPHVAITNKQEEATPTNWYDPQIQQRQGRILGTIYDRPVEFLLDWLVIIPCQDFCYDWMYSWGYFTMVINPGNCSASPQRNNGKTPLTK